MARTPRKEVTRTPKTRRITTRHLPTLATLCAIAFLVAEATALAAYQQVDAWGSEGSGEKQFSYQPPGASGQAAPQGLDFQSAAQENRASRLHVVNGIPLARKVNQ